MMRWTLRGALQGLRQIGHLGDARSTRHGRAGFAAWLGNAPRAILRRPPYAVCGSTFPFGFATDTYDADGAPQGPDSAPVIDRAEIETAQRGRLGHFPQIPRRRFPP